jgi:hypothetical protein
MFEVERPGADNLRLRADKVYAIRHTPKSVTIKSVRVKTTTITPATIKPGTITRATITGEIIAGIPAGPVELW